MNNILIANDYEEFVSRLRKLTSNLIFHRAPLNSDYSIIYDDKVDKYGFLSIFFDLLYGTGAHEERLERYLTYISEHDLKFKWTFPTYFLYLIHPKTEIFIKPSVTKWFLDFVGSEVRYSSHPNIEIYSTFKQLAHLLKDQLEYYQPKDMIDIQSFIYVAYIEFIKLGEEGRQHTKKSIDYDISGGKLIPEGTRYYVYRKIRDSALCKNLKLLHSNKCQLCSKVIEFDNGEKYSEAHHIMPLGKDHNGPDIKENILVLCPDHHVLCDFGGIKLNLEEITMHPKHEIDEEYIDYHNKRIYKA